VSSTKYYLIQLVNKYSAKLHYIRHRDSGNAGGRHRLELATNLRSVSSDGQLENYDRAARIGKGREVEVSMATHAPTAEDFLAGYSAAVQRIALSARVSIIKSITGCSEVLDAKARLIGYGYGTGYRDTVCVLILSKAGVKLGIPDGSTLPDPEHLLQGAGRQHRHIPLTTPELIESPPLKAMLRNALRAYRARRDVTV
jgi:hypothetical protein